MQIALLLFIEVQLALFLSAFCCHSITGVPSTLVGSANSPDHGRTISGAELRQKLCCSAHLLPVLLLAIIGTWLVTWSVSLRFALGCVSLLCLVLNVVGTWLFSLRFACFYTLQNPVSHLYLRQDTLLLSFNNYWHPIIFSLLCKISYFFSCKLCNTPYKRHTNSLWSVNDTRLVAWSISLQLA